MGEPSQCEAIGSRFWAGLAKQKVAWRVCQTYLTVFALCRQHVPASDLEVLWRTLGARWVGAVCPGFFDGAVEIWRAIPAKFQGVELVIPQGTHLVHDMTRTMCIGPHCQCASVWDTWEAAPNKCIRKVSSRKPEHLGRCGRVPRYVVAKAAHAVKEDAQAFRGGSLFEPER